MTGSGKKSELARIRAIFGSVMDAAPDDRSAALTRLCGTDAALLAEVSALVSAASLEDDFLQPPRHDATAAKSLPFVPLREQPAKMAPGCSLAKVANGALIHCEVRPLGFRPADAIDRMRKLGPVLATFAHPAVAALEEMGLTETADGKAAIYLGNRLIADAQRIELTSISSGRADPGAKAMEGALRDAVSAMQAAGLQHGDLGNQSLWVGPDGHPCIVGLGLGTIVGRTRGGAGLSDDAGSIDELFRAR